MFSDVKLVKPENIVTDLEALNVLWNNTFSGIIVLDKDYKILLYNKIFENIFGYNSKELLGQKVTKILPNLIGNCLDTKLTKQLSEEEKVAIGFRKEVAGITKNGTQLTIEIDKSIAKNNSKYYFVVQDISKRKQFERDLYDEKIRTHHTLESIHEGVVTTNTDGIIEYVNPIAEYLSGYLTEDCIGKPFDLIFVFTNEATSKKEKNVIKKCIKEGKEIHLEDDAILISRNNIFETPIFATISPQKSFDNEIVGCVIIIRDVSTTRKLSAEISWQASHDSLTGLMNRREFERRLAKILIDAKQGDEQHVLCFLDLDQFKIVNDTCGHAAGDELLRQLTNALDETMRRSDILARLGGDEFGVLLPHCSANRGEKIANIWRKLIQDYRFSWSGNNFVVGVSIGLVPLGKFTSSAEAAMAAADSACYVAKEMGRNRVHVFRENDKDFIERKGEMQWASRIESALENNKFRLFYQEIRPVNLNSGLRGHIEILLRLEAEDGTIMLPGAFIPAAERYQLMSKIDRWVVENTLEWMGKYTDLLGDVVVGINISGASISDDGLLDFVMDKFVKNSIFPNQTCFEITETATISNLTKATAFINSLREFGCSFALDDFGSGLSSFAYLKNMEVDFLKVDGAFVKDMLNDDVNHAIVCSINQIGHVVGLKTIAEFVENDEILEQLKAIKVDYAQGYGIHKPTLLEEYQPFKRKD